jgi:hypothetical protein
VIDGAFAKVIDGALQIRETVADHLQAFVNKRRARAENRRSATTARRTATLEQKLLQAHSPPNRRFGG